MAVPNRISIITLGVADVTAATAFYESLGWRRSSSSVESMTFFSMQGSALGLYQWDSLADDAKVPSAGSGFRGVALALNCASRDEVDSVFAEWVSAGGADVLAPHAAFWGGYSSYVADPDSHLWEIVHNPYASNDADGRLVLGPPAD
jgi:predicted lactoylglutathione lyase